MNSQKKAQQSWTGASRGASQGPAATIRMIQRFGPAPAHFFNIPVSLIWSCRDLVGRKAIADFRNKLGLPNSPWHYFRHYYSFGRSYIDRLAFLLNPSVKGYTWNSVNEDIFQQELDKGNGLILLGAHIGNCELAGNLLAKRISVPFNAIMSDAERDDIRALLQPALRKRSIRIINSSAESMDTLLQSVAALKRGEIVSLFGDRVVKGARTCEASFLGSAARFPLMPYALGAATGAPIIPFFVVRTQGKRYTFTAGEPLEVEHDRTCQSHQAALKKFVALLEHVARTSPYEWFNFYRFWDD